MTISRQEFDRLSNRVHNLESGQASIFAAAKKVQQSGKDPLNLKREHTCVIYQLLATYEGAKKEYVHRTDDEGNILWVDDVNDAMQFTQDAADLIVSIENEYSTKPAFEIETVGTVMSKANPQLKDSVGEHHELRRFVVAQNFDEGKRYLTLLAGYTEGWTSKKEDAKVFNGIELISPLQLNPGAWVEDLSEGFTNKEYMEKVPRGEIDCELDEKAVRAARTKLVNHIIPIVHHTGDRHLMYDIQYRVKGREKWVRANVTTVNCLLYDLRPNTTYEYQLQQNPLAGSFESVVWSETREFTTGTAKAKGLDPTKYHSWLGVRGHYMVWKFTQKGEQYLQMTRDSYAWTDNKHHATKTRYHVAKEWATELEADVMITSTGVTYGKLPEKGIEDSGQGA